VAVSGLNQCAPNDNAYCDSSGNNYRVNGRAEPKWHPGKTPSKPLFDNNQEAEDDKNRREEHEEVSSGKACEKIVDSATYCKREYHGQKARQESGEWPVASVVQVIAKQGIPVAPKSRKRGGAEGAPKRVCNSPPSSIRVTQAAALILCVRRSFTHSR
jgi:hypothetical protein